MWKTPWQYTVEGSDYMLFLYWKRSLLTFALVIVAFIVAVVHVLKRDKYEKLSSFCFYLALFQGIHFFIFLYLHELKHYPLTYTWMYLDLTVFCAVLLISSLIQGVGNTLMLNLGMYLLIWIIWAVLSIAWHIGLLLSIIVMLLIFLLATNI